jgi:hypothetical protein
MQWLLEKPLYQDSEIVFSFQSEVSTSKSIFKSAVL